MATMREITCKCGCGRKKNVRVADIKRGWGKFFSKRCKAKHQEKRTGQYKRFDTENYMGSGVSKAKFMRYAEEYGGTPQFDRNGEYEGFCSHFSNED